MLYVNISVGNRFDFQLVIGSIQYQYPVRGVGGTGTR